MTCSIIGLGEDFILSSKNTKIDANGICEITETYLVRADSYDLDDFFSEVQERLNQPHEDESHLLCYNANASAEAGFHKATFVYKGIEQGKNQIALEIDMALSEEAIETHEDFEEFAGTPQEPKNDAQFNDDGTFKGFRITAGTCPPEQENNKQGVSSYLFPTCTIIETQKSGQRSSTSRKVVGEIVTQGFEHQVPGLDNTTRFPRFKAKRGSRDFLVIGEDKQPYGKGEIVKTKHRMSGKRKWNDSIYDKA